MTIYVEMIESGPHPGGFVVRIQVHDVIPEHVGHPGESGQVCKALVRTCQNQEMPIGEGHDVMMNCDGSPRVSGGGQCLVEIVDREFVNNIARQVDFSNHSTLSC